MSSFDLVGIATPELERLLRALQHDELGPVFDAAGLRSRGFATQVSTLRPLFGSEPKVVATMLELVLAERRRHAGRQPPELVFTRTGTVSSSARDTSAVFAELCDLAQREVFIAGFTFTGDVVLAPLYRAMASRGVRARIVLDCSQAEVEGAEDQALPETLSKFWKHNWKDLGEPRPEILYDPLTCKRHFERGRRSRWTSEHSMHAKCLIIDDAHALIGSANFTHRAVADNIEVGVVIHEREFVRKLLGQWEDAISERVLVRA